MTDKCLQHTYNRVNIYNMEKAPIKQQDEQLMKWRGNKQIIIQEIKMCNKYMQRCLASLIIKRYTLKVSITFCPFDWQRGKWLLPSSVGEKQWSQFMLIQQLHKCTHTNSHKSAYTDAHMMPAAPFLLVNMETTLIPITRNWSNK